VSNGDAEAWLNLALFLRRQARLVEMEQSIVRLGQTQAYKGAGLVEGSGLLYRTSRNFPLAAELLQRYLGGEPVEAAPAFKAHYLLGAVLEKQGDKPGARAAYEAAIAVDPKFVQASDALKKL